MPNDIDWDNQGIDEDENQGNQGGGSKAIKALRDLHKADETKISELTTQLETLLSKDRERTTKEVLEKKGVNPKAARLVLKDVTDVTEENIDAWLKDNAELFNLTIAPDTGQESEGTSGESEELGRQDALTSQAVTPGTGNSLEAKINSFKTFEELEAFVASQQK